MTLQDLADLVADLINKHGPNCDVVVDHEKLGMFLELDGTYKTHKYEVGDSAGVESYVVLNLAKEK